MLYSKQGFNSPYYKQNPLRALDKSEQDYSFSWPNLILRILYCQIFWNYWHLQKNSSYLVLQMTETIGYIFEVTLVFLSYLIWFSQLKATISHILLSFCHEPFEYFYLLNDIYVSDCDKKIYSKILNMNFVSKIKIK